jgi:IS5 family transposase
MVSNPWVEGIEAIVFRTVGDQVSLWEAVLPPELLKLPDELARVDELLDDPVFFAPFAPFFDLRVGRPSTPMETYLRLMFLKFPCVSGLGETAVVADHRYRARQDHHYP